jgi:hypothetical protein
MGKSDDSDFKCYLRGDILKAQTWEGHSEKVVGIFSNLTYPTVFEVAEHESEVRF